jgi:DNA ligase 1
MSASAVCHPPGAPGISVQWKSGIWLPEFELALDPRTSAKLAFVSHAHSDHTGHHEQTIASVATARLMRERFGAGRGTFTELNFGETRDFGSFSAKLLPAGHIVGSAQLYLEGLSGSLLYTGDYKLREGLSAQAAQFCRADTLIIEATFGRSHYCFPPTAQVLADIRQFCRETLEDGETPVLLGYSLGKAQELIRAISGEGWPVVLHPAVWEMTRLVQELEGSSQDLERWPNLEKFQQQSLAGRVLICPPSVQGSSLLRKLPRRRVAMISGWALEPGAVHRYQCDAAFPLSDHADYPDLLRAVELVQPRRIYVVHGFAREFAADLRQRGYEAWALGQADQLELSMESKPIATPLPIPSAGLPTDSGWGRFCALADQRTLAQGRISRRLPSSPPRSRFTPRRRLAHGTHLCRCGGTWPGHRTSPLAQSPYPHRRPP